MLCLVRKLCNSKCFFEMCIFNWRMFSVWSSIGFGEGEIPGQEVQTQFLVYWNREGRFVHLWWSQFRQLLHYTEAWDLCICLWQGGRCKLWVVDQGWVL